MTFEEYYKHYLTLHQNKWCRRLHVLGQLSTIVYILVCIKINLLLLVFAPFVVYPFAWSGHYFFEKNKPAAFRDPVKAKICDWIMLKDIIIGRIKL
jgi:hypothetical protein